MSIDPHRDLYGTGLRIAVFEYLCSSGAYQDSGPSGPYAELINEGAAMLLALCDDLAGCQQTVCIALEPTLQAAWEHQAHRRSILKKIKTHGITNGPDPSIQRVAQQWTTIAQGCDCAIVIAPELDGLLAGIIQAMRKEGCHVIAPDDLFIQCASDKWETYRHWSRQIQSPESVQEPFLDCALIETKLASHWLDAYKCHTTTDPESDGWVLKRRLTAGGTDMKRFGSSRCLADHLGNMQELDRWIVQPWIAGKPCSFAIAGRDVIGPFEQIFDAHSGNYIGGYGPLECNQEKLFAFAKKLAQAIPRSVSGEPSQGWVGIDFVISSSGRWLPLEINARLTSSYLGYRRIYGPQLALTLLGQPLPSGSKPSMLNSQAFRFSVNEFHG